MDGNSDCEMGRRFESEDPEAPGEPMSPSKAKAGDSMVNNITLWQFLLELLVNSQYKHIICWTNTEGEFKLVNAEEVARLWGLRKNKNNMNYDKLSRALRYYYDKNIIKKVLGQKFVYRFVSFPDIAKSDPKIFPVKMEPMCSSKVSPGSVSPYSPGMVPSPVPSPSSSGLHNGANGLASSAPPSANSSSTTSSNPSSQHRTPPPAHIASYPSLGHLAHMYQAVSKIAAAASLGGYLTALASRSQGDFSPQSNPNLWSSQEILLPRSPSPASEDSKDIPEAPLHLVSEEASRRRREEEAEERKREQERKDRSRSRSKSPLCPSRSSTPKRRSPNASPFRSRSPLASPSPSTQTLCTPLTPPLMSKDKAASALHFSVSSAANLTSSYSSAKSSSGSGNSSSCGGSSKARFGRKPKPSPLSIDNIVESPPVVSPRQFSASSLNTPVVSLPSPPYSGVGTKSPYLPLHLFSSMSPLAAAASLSPHYGSIPNRHFTHFPFEALPPSQYPMHPPVLSPILPPTSYEFSLSSPSEKSSTTVPVQQ